MAMGEDKGKEQEQKDPLWALKTGEDGKQLTDESSNLVWVFKDNFVPSDLVASKRFELSDHFEKMKQDNQDYKNIVELINILLELDKGSPEYEKYKKSLQRHIFNAFSDGSIDPDKDMGNMQDFLVGITSMGSHSIFRIFKSQDSILEEAKSQHRETDRLNHIFDTAPNRGLDYCLREFAARHYFQELIHNATHEFHKFKIERIKEILVAIKGHHEFFAESFFDNDEVLDYLSKLIHHANDKFHNFAVNKTIKMLDHIENIGEPFVAKVSNINQEDYLQVRKRGDAQPVELETTLLTMAARYGQVEIVKYILDRFKSQLGLKDKMELNYKDVSTVDHTKRINKTALQLITENKERCQKEGKVEASQTLKTLKISL